MNNYLTKTIGRKIGALVVLSFLSMLCIIIISITFFGKISKISTLADVGNAANISFYQSVSYFKQFELNSSEQSFQHFITSVSFIRQKAGAVVKLHRFLKDGDSIQEAVAKHEKDLTSFDHNGSIAAAQLIKTIMGKAILNNLVNTSENAIQLSNKVLELGQLFKDTSDETRRKEILHDLEETNTQLGTCAAQILVDFKNIITYLINFVRRLFIIVVVVILIPLGFLSFKITRSITTPLKQTVYFSTKMARGDFTEELRITNHDELGDMAKALNSMTKGLTSIMRDIKGGIETLTSSSSSLFEISEHVSMLAGQSSDKANRVSTSTKQMSSNLNMVAVAMNESSTNVSIVSGSSEEMSKTIAEISQNTERARRISDSAVELAKNASTKMSELGQVAQKIGKVTETITEISEQTNLLALNATIEAARAGDSGKGFAVVANEIKELAKQTAIATVDIKKEISEMQATTQNTITEIEQVSKVIDSINEFVAMIAAAVEEQSVVTKEISNNIDQLSTGVSEVNENVAQSSNSACDIAREIEDVYLSSTDMAKSSSKIKISAEGLTQLTGHLNQMVSKFKVN